MALKIDPSDLSPSAWWKADSITVVDGAAVSPWLDSSGNGRSLSQATPGYTPRLIRRQLNGLPAVRFDGSDDLLTTAVNLSVLLGTDGVGTILAVVRYQKAVVGDGAGHGVLGIDTGVGSTGGTKLSLRLDNTPEEFEAGNYDGAADYATLPAPANTADEAAGLIASDYTNLSPFPRVVMWRHDTTAGEIQVGVDNLDDAAVAGVTSGASTGLAAALLVGASAEDYWKGDIFEVIVFPTALSEAERRGVGLYLTEKYGLPYESGIAEDAGETSATMLVEMELPSTELQLEPVLWLKADAITGLSDSDPVVTWEDSSGNGHDPTQGTAGFRPLFKANVINGLPAVLFDGSDDILATTSKLNAIMGFDGRGTVYAVMRADTTSPEQTHTLFANASGDVHLAVVDTAGSDTVQAANYDGTQDTATRPYTMGQWGIPWWMLASLAGSGEGVIDGILGGLDTSTNAAETATGATTASKLAEVFQIGGNATVGYLNGYIAELIVFPRGHTGAERRHVLSYLAAKYALTYEDTTYEPVWVNVTPDVRSSQGLHLRYGMEGAEVNDRVASAGELSFVLENAATENSAGLEGYYSPEHANVRSGFQVGTPVRLCFEFYGTRYFKWQGWIENIRVATGKNLARAVEVRARDWLDYAARMTLSGLAIQTDKDAGTLFFSLYVNSPRAPVSAWLDVGSDTYPYAFDNTTDEGVLILSEIFRLTISELGYAYIRGDTVGGGQLRFEARGARDGSVVRWAMTDPKIQAMNLSEHGLEGIINRVLVELHPRRVDAAATTVLFSLWNTPLVASGESITFVAPYRDPASGRFARVGGTSMVTPVATTDYTGNSQADGGGTDRTANFTVTPTFGGNSALMVVSNSGPDAYLTKCQLRGKGVYAFETVLADLQDAASIAAYGQMSRRIDMPYQDDVNLASSLAALILANNSQPRTKVRAVSFVANWNAAAMMHTLAREIGDRVTVTEQVSGLAAAEYFIQGIQIAVVSDSKIAARWLLVPADQEDYSAEGS
jgi:hypothetical protein